MKRASFIALSLSLWAVCANRAATHTDARSRTATPTPRLRFDFENGAFALKSREVFPYPPGNVMNYQAAVRVGDE